MSGYSSNVGYRIESSNISEISIFGNKQQHRIGRVLLFTPSHLRMFYADTQRKVSTYRNRLDLVFSFVGLSDRNRLFSYRIVSKSTIVYRNYIEFEYRLSCNNVVSNLILVRSPILITIWRTLSAADDSNLCHGPGTFLSQVKTQKHRARQQTNRRRGGPKKTNTPLVLSHLVSSRPVSSIPPHSRLHNSHRGFSFLTL